MAHAFSATWTIFLLFWIDGVWNAEVDLSKVVCQSGWERYGAGECIWLSDTTAAFDTAETACIEKGGQLLTLLKEEKEEFVNNITRRKGEEFWIGLFTTSNYYNPRLRWKHGAHDSTGLSYSNFVGSYVMNTCGYLGSGNNRWLSTQTCSEERKFICQKPSACIKGWFGASCDMQCHCLEENCPKTTGQCSLGCQIGWHGSRCNHPVVTAEGSLSAKVVLYNGTQVSNSLYVVQYTPATYGTCTLSDEMSAALFYCFNSKVRGKYMLLRVNPKRMHYEVMGAIDGDGVGVDGCDKASFTLDDDTGVFSRVVNITDGVNINDGVNSTDGVSMTNGDSSRCGGIVTEEGTWKWTFRVQEFSGLLSRADLDIAVKCNFNNADTLSSDGVADVEGTVDTVVRTLDETREEVKLTVINPVTLEEVKKIQLGGNVMLKLAIDTKPGSGARGVSAYNCEAYTSDGMYKRQLTDKHGCAASGSPVSGVNASVTFPFAMFTFPGHSSVNFRCQYDYCFHDEIECVNRCRLRHRRKRSEDAIRGVRKPVFTTVRVLQDDEQGKAVKRLEVLPSEDTNRGFPLL